MKSDNLYKIKEQEYEIGFKTLAGKVILTRKKIFVKLSKNHKDKNNYKIYMDGQFLIAHKKWIRHYCEELK